MCKLNVSNCEKCIQSVYSGKWVGMKKIGGLKGGLILYQCINCGAYWEENLREAHVISDKDAKKKFAELFSC